MTKRYQKKPVVVDAVQWMADNTKDVLEFIGEPLTTQVSPDGKKIRMFTPEGYMTASLHDWIIKGVEGEFYPCKPNIFDLCYKEVT